VRKALVGERHTDYQLLSLTKRGVIIRDLSENKGKFSSDMGTSQEVRPGDLVFCLFDVPETPRTVGLSKHRGMITGAYTVMESDDLSVARFVEAFYIAMDDRKLLSPLYSGLRNTIPKARLLGAKTPIPPASELGDILAFVTAESTRIQGAVDKLEREISLLQEYRARLVADVVTGKVDVREAANKVPEDIPTDITADMDHWDTADNLDQEARV
jgi:type I restriction enzyme S subunit